MRSGTTGLIRRTTMMAAAAAVALALAGCGGSSGNDTGSTASDDSGTTTVGGRTVNDHGTKDVTGMTQVDVEADDYYFEPSVLTGDPGQQLTLTVDNATTGTEHNITLGDQAVNKDIEGGEHATVSVTIPESGVVSFFCEYHVDRGMAGGLAVTGASLTGGAGTTTKSPSTGRY